MKYTFLIVIRNTRYLWRSKNIHIQDIFSLNILKLKICYLTSLTNHSLKKIIDKLLSCIRRHFLKLCLFRNSNVKLFYRPDFHYHFYVIRYNDIPYTQNNINQRNIQIHRLLITFINTIHKLLIAIINTRRKLQIKFINAIRKLLIKFINTIHKLLIKFNVNSEGSVIIL